MCSVQKIVISSNRVIITNSNKTGMTNSSIIYNNKLHKQKEYFFFAIFVYLTTEMAKCGYERGAHRIMTIAFQS